MLLSYVTSQSHNIQYNNLHLTYNKLTIITYYVNVKMKESFLLCSFIYQI